MGCGYSSAPDLLNFSNALINGKLLQDSYSLNFLQAFQSETTGDHPTKHSMGFMVGDNWFGHAGHYDGATAELRIYPKSHYIVAILANRDGEAATDLAEFVENVLPT